MKRSTRNFMLSSYVLFTISIFVSTSFVGCLQPSASTAQLRPVNSPNSSTNLTTGLTLSAISSREDLPYEKYVKTYSKEYGIDWTLISAMMKQESRFNHRAVSRSGAYGLMQLMPETQIELSEKLGIHDFTKPRNNIRAGIYHLRLLYDSFGDAEESDRVRLSLAAYNAGLTRINDAQELVRHLGGNPNRWSDVRGAMAMLSPKYSTLHRAIWHENAPTSGYFRDWKQTTRYVDAVVKYRDRFELAEM